MADQSPNTEQTVAELETIYALSSGAGVSGVAVIRVSGPETVRVIEALSPGRGVPAPRMATLRWFICPQTERALDQGILIWFPGPASFTGEDVAEFHIHGGRAVVAAFLATLSELPGLRMAEQGEFTRRAFDNGRLDLTAVEGLADLIHAQTDKQRELALRQMGGALSALYQNWRQMLLTALAYTEADIDFADEEVPDDVYQRVYPMVKALRAEMAGHLADNKQGERLREGIYIVILGAPNAGKSSLLNALSRRDVAIVSDIAGTTRDSIEVHLDLGGYPVTLVDTAGLRESGDQIEQEGIRRSLLRAEEADIKLVMADARQWPAIDVATAALLDEKSFLLVNKIDLTDGDKLVQHGPSGQEKGSPLAVSFISAATGAGLDEFMDVLTVEVAGLFDQRETPLITRQRHREYVQKAVESLDLFLVDSEKDLELAAEDLRMAARALGRITGLVDVEDILGKIFSEFCIGK